MDRGLWLLLPMMLACCALPVSEDSSDDGARAADDAGLPVSQVRYFPPPSEQPRMVCDYGGRTRSEPIIDDFRNRWFSQHLAAAKEPSLYLATQAGRVSPFTIRFTWLRSFDAPVFIRVETDAGGKYRLTAKELSGAGGYDPGSIKRKVERELRADEAKRLQRLFTETRFFQLPPKDCMIGCDGAEWIFERAEGEDYHVLTRCSPEQGPVREVGDYLIKLTGWAFPDVY